MAADRDEGKGITRGHPSYAWHFGQERRLEMIAQAGRLAEGCRARVLVDGCGVGMYVRALRRFTPHVYGLDIEPERAVEARQASPLVHVAAAEALPYPAAAFDLVLSHEVLEHVADDKLAAQEMVRVLKPGGRAVIFAPNRAYPFETHGVFWRGEYHFGNIPLVNWLPDAQRNRLAPHVRAYRAHELRELFAGLPVRLIAHTQVYPGYDKVAVRRPRLGSLLRNLSYALEKTPLRSFGLSHLLVVEKLQARD
jgi:SAM-dependent methyltransferase